MYKERGRDRNDYRVTVGEREREQKGVSGEPWYVNLSGPSSKHGT